MIYLQDKYYRDRQNAAPSWLHSTRRQSKSVLSVQVHWGEKGRNVKLAMSWIGRMMDKEGTQSKCYILYLNPYFLFVTHHEVLKSQHRSVCRSNIRVLRTPSNLAKPWYHSWYTKFVFKDDCSPLTPNSPHFNQFIIFQNQLFQFWIKGITVSITSKCDEYKVFNY